MENRLWTMLDRTTDYGPHDHNQITSSSKIKKIVLNVCLWSVVGLHKIIIRIIKVKNFDLIVVCDPLSVV